MTGKLPSGRRSGPCPDPDALAAHVDRRLQGEEARRMDEHIATCPDCYEVFAETLQFGLTEAEEAGVRPAGAPARAPLRLVRSRAWIAGVAVAAVVLLGLGVWLVRERARVPVSVVAELAQAMGPRRFVEPRLTGGFQHGRLVVLRSGQAPQGLDAQPPAVLAAVARIRERAEREASPEALGALGVTYLVSGDPSAAVKTLESASAQKPDAPRLMSDLAAAYLVRAARADEPADIPRALEASERAIALPDAPAEAYFNRALALERLHLVDAARKAWEDYLQRDPSSGWADEARQHLEALPASRPSSADEEKARVRAALEGGSAAVDRLADEAPSLLRDYFEDEILPAWAEAHLVGHPDAGVQRERARLVGDTLLRATEDALPRDTALALEEPSGAAPARDPLRAQALGYRAFREAKRLYEGQRPSCESYRMALRDLTAGASPYEGWARLQVVIACQYPSELGPALDELARLEGDAEPRAHRQLLGRIRGLQGLIHAVRGELTRSLERYRSAQATFHATGDVDNEAWMFVAIAENLHALGERRGATWRDRARALALLGEVRKPSRRHGIFGEAALACLDERLPACALHYETAVLEAASRWSSAAAMGEALVRRAAIHHALAAPDRAAADLREARQTLPRIEEKVWSERLAAEADALEGELLVRQRPEEASQMLGRSVAYFQAATPPRVPYLKLLLARSRAAQGSHEAAEAELLAGIEALERGRTYVQDASLRVSFFDQASALFDEMVRLQVANRRDPERALAFVERGHARELVDSLLGAEAAALEPDALRQELPDGLALVYFLPLEDRLLAWVLTRERSEFTERSLPAAALSGLVSAHRAALEARAPEHVVRRAAGRLHDALVRPLLPFIASERALVLVADGVLQSVAFGGLWNPETGRYLIEDHLLAAAPSGTVFLRASAATTAARGTGGRSLIVGNPRFDRRLFAGLADLPGADAEAAEIAALYARSELLSGSTATRSAFLAGVRRSEIVHYAGHAAATADAPSATRLFLAPDPGTGDSGALHLHELGHLGFKRTRVVVLAACRTAAGPVSRVEGALSLGRPFLAAGVPDVVASLWDIDDALSRRFFVAFHRALSAGGDPVVALRRAQIAMLRGGDAALAHPASWAAFICMGGIDPHSLSKGEES